MVGGRQLAQLFKGAPGGLLFCFLLRRSNASSQRFCLHGLIGKADLNQESLAMIGTAFTLDDILRLTAFLRLQPLLQSGFVIADDAVVP